MVSHSTSHRPRPRGPGRFVALCLVLLVLAASCAPRGPDLRLLYDRAAQQHDLGRNPVIVIPGFIGSRLEAAGEEVPVWGLLGGKVANPSNGDGARRVALPMDPTKVLAELEDDVEATEVLETLRLRLLGVPVDISAYFQILATLGAAGYRDEGLGLSGAVDYGGDHYSCFQFPYDWRRDLVESARALHHFIEEKKATVESELAKRYPEEPPSKVRFDVVAHSMGGLVLRYYLRYGAADLPSDGSLPPLTWAGAKNIDKAVLVGTPNAGSVEALESLVEGRKFGLFIPRYPAAVLGTFPSLYQLLPRSRHRPVVLAEDLSQPVGDLYDPALWQRFGWGLADPRQEPVLRQLLPEVDDAAERRRIALDHQAKALRRAEQVAAALDRPAEPPPGTTLHLLAGDAVLTPARVAVEETSGRLIPIEEAPGDGRVLRTSALLDERLAGPWQRKLVTPIDWQSVTFLFSNHLGLTKDPAFTDNILFLLLEKPN